MLYTNYYGCCRLLQTTIKNCKVSHLKSTNLNCMQVTALTCCNIQTEPSPKVFNRGALRFCGGLCVCAGGLDIKLTKTPLIYSVSRFNLGVLGTLFGRLTPPKPPRGDGTAYKSNSTTALCRLLSAVQT